MEQEVTAKIRLSREGEWFQGTQPITHERTLELFNRSVMRQESGYCLSGEKQPVPIEVEDTAFFVRGLDRSDRGYVIHLIDGSVEELDLKTLSFGQENELYCQIKNGSEKAKFLRAPFYEIMKDLVEESGYFGLRSMELFYPLKRVAPPPQEVPVVKAAVPRVVEPVKKGDVKVAAKAPVEKKAVSKKAPVKKAATQKTPAKKAAAKKPAAKKAKKKTGAKKKSSAKKPVKKTAQKAAKKTVGKKKKSSSVRRRR